MPSLVALAEELLANAKQLEAHTQAQGLPEPSFERDIFGSMAMEQELVRMAIVDTAKQLRRLVAGPMALAMELELGVADNAALRIVYTYRMIHHVPLDGSVTFGELAERCGLDEVQVRRFVRHAMANHVFLETEPGRVSHSSLTRTMRADPDLEDHIGSNTCEFAPAFAMLPEALARWPQSPEGAESAYALAWPMRDGGEKRAFYEFLEQHPERRRRFGQSMKLMAKHGGVNLRHLTATFPWADLDQPGTTLVDVGGGHGAVSQHLAQHTNHIHFVVQDLPGTVVTARTSLPPEFKDRIEFIEHDFFAPQTITDAHVFFFRWIFHNHSEQYCEKILRGLIPAMRTGTRVIVFEMILLDRAPRSSVEKLAFDADLVMKTVWNAGERTEAQWLALFQKASPKFVFRGITHMPGSSLSIIEHVWEG